MPVTMERPALHADAKVSDIRERRGRNIRRPITIGVVNNMPDAALAATERQFLALLEAASCDHDVALAYYTIGAIPRSPDALRYIDQRYADIASLGEQTPDALIITGTQPLAPDLRQEPYWPALTDLIDWAEAHTASTILSCLAAHAGVLHLSGIARRALPAKCSGVYACDFVQSDPLTRGARSPWVIPHSRYNGLDEGDLTRKGYVILSSSALAGVDIFVRRTRSLLLFLQGHPEYESGTLAREFRRDMSRYLDAQLTTPPNLPHSYFPIEVERALQRFADMARSERRVETMAAFPDLMLNQIEASWRESAVLLYRNWLNLIAERKAEGFANFSKMRSFAAVER